MQKDAQVSNKSCSPQRQIFENLAIIWLGSNLNEVRVSLAEVHRIVNSVRAFDEPDACVDFLTDINDQYVSLILSSGLTDILVPLIHDVPQLYAIYLFCDNKSNHEESMKEWEKIKGVFSKTETSVLSAQLRNDTQQSDRYLASISIIPKSSVIGLNELDSAFMYSKLLKEVLLVIENDGHVKADFVNFCREEYADNNTTLAAIDKFERDYNHESSIWWYTKEPFIYSVLNRALRTQDIAIILKLSFFIRDLHRQIEQIHLSTRQTKKLTVYRGQSMPNAEFKKLQKSNGGLLSFNCFMSTSSDRDVSFAFADSAQANPNLTGILFEMEIDSVISSIPYASLGNISYYSDTEKEILFSMHTVFRIGELQHIDNRLWVVKLTMTSDNDQQLLEVTEQIRNEIGRRPGWHRLASLMIEMGEFRKAEEIYKKMLELTSADNIIERALLHNELGYINQHNEDVTSALFHLKQALAMKLTYLSPDGHDLSATYNNIGAALLGQGDLDEAMKYFQLSLNIELQTPHADQLDIALRYSNIALVLYNQGKRNEALKNIEHTLAIQLDHLAMRHPLLATTYGNIGGIHLDMKDYSVALSYYEKAREIQEKSLPPNHPSLAITYDNIANIHQNMEDHSTALSYYEKAHKIMEKSLPPNHPSVMRINTHIGDLLTKLGLRNGSLHHYQRALEVGLKTPQPDQFKIAAMHNNIGALLDKQGKFNEALQSLEKALEMEFDQSPSHSELLATIYSNIGEAHRAKKKYVDALLSHEKTLEIRQSFLPANHPSLAATHRNIAMLLGSLCRHQEAIQHALQAVQIARNAIELNELHVLTCEKTLDELLEEI